MRRLINNRMDNTHISMIEAKLIEMFPHDKILSDMHITDATPLIQYHLKEDSDDSIATEASVEQAYASR